MRAHFPEVQKPFRYEGPDSRKALAFKCYYPRGQEGAKTMTENLKSSSAYPRSTPWAEIGNFFPRRAIPCGFLNGPRRKPPDRIILAAITVVVVLFMAATSSLLNEQQFVFLKDAIQKTIIFIAIALLAVFLNLLVDWMAGIQLSPVIIFGIKVLEYLIFVIDMAWFGLYLAVTARQMIIDVLADAYIP
jgi:hypothetical protein